MFKPIERGETGPPNDRGIKIQNPIQTMSVNIKLYNELLYTFIAVVIIILSRLVYRKGVDLMSGVIPIIVNKYDDVSCF